MMRRALLAVALMALAGKAEAAPFMVRGAGAQTALAVDLGTVTALGASRAAWTYQFFWSRRAFPGRKVEVLAVLQSVNCDSRVERALATTHYTADGKVMTRTGLATPWTTSLSGSNTDYILDVMCGTPDRAWARVTAANVFEAYRHVWAR